MSESKLGSLPSDYQEVWAVLNRDFWIEKISDSDSENEIWSTAHDLLVDQMVHSYVSYQAISSKRFVLDLFSFAAKWGNLRSALETLQRVVFLEELQTLDWKDLFHDQIDQSPENWIAQRNFLLRTSLMPDPLDRLQLLSTHDDFWQGVEMEWTFHSSLVWFARWALSQNAEIQVRVRNSALETWMQKSIVYRWNNPGLVKSGIRLYPQSFGPALITILPDYQVDLDFVCRAWLLGKGEPTTIQPYVANWLERHGSDVVAQFLYKSWLDAKGEKTFVETYIRSWLKNHHLTKEAGFVYSSWLDANGQKDLVRESIMEWLKLNQTSAEAQFVYHSWLDANGEIELVREPFVEWLNFHRIIAEARFVYRSWLDAKGEIDLVRESIVEWLKLHQTITEAEFVYAGWLKAGGEKDLVREPIMEWLKLHQTIIDAEFVYAGWLDGKGEIELVREPIMEWLKLHQTSADAQFVYSSWLKAGGEIDLVKEPIMEWLNLHQTITEAGFVYRGWLDSGEDFSTIRNNVLDWLEIHWDLPDATFVIKYIGKNKDLPLPTVKNILQWCQKFPENEDSLSRLSQLIPYYKYVEIADYLCTTLEATLQPKFKNPLSIDSFTSFCIIRILTALCRLVYFRLGPFSDRINILLSDWVLSELLCPKNHPSQEKIESFAFARRVLLLVYFGKLDIKNDRSAIERFLRWVDQWDPANKVSLPRILNFLKREVPDTELWDIVQI